MSFLDRWLGLDDEETYLGAKLALIRAELKAEASKTRLQIAEKEAEIRENNRKAEEASRR